ncbi:YfbU family protein [Flavobacterium sp.]|uniref:YfbU family protein n=1 Tax=Flavobacterium sp. TaxID=239 RepID=UPI0028BF030C|nr:YfbU family protein [Flavobacterium sp.]
MIPESLSIIERQILTNQYRILSKLESDNPEYETKIEILESGFTEQYYEVFDVSTEEVPLEVCEETTQILNMYRRINNCIKKLSESEKNTLNLSAIAFEGFGANGYLHNQYMTFMIEKMNLWREYRFFDLENKSKNALSKYRKMLEYQEFLLENDQYDITNDDLKKLVIMLEKETLLA